MDDEKRALMQAAHQYEQSLAVVAVDRPEPPVTASVRDLAAFYLAQAREYAAGQPIMDTVKAFALEDGWDDAQADEIARGTIVLRHFAALAEARDNAARGRRLDGTYREGRRA